jgi:hypothetical protein
MKYWCLIALWTLTVGAHARKPAVEDFIGIESEASPVNPAGTETLYNFSTEISRFEEAPVEVTVVRTTPSAIAPQTQPTNWTLSPWWAVAAVLLLPLTAWRLVMRKVEELPTADNVTLLAAHRAKKKVEEYKKAS